jgi:hypothetical protein
MVFVLITIGIFALSGALRWSSNDVIVTQRNARYYNSLSAAEGTSEKVLAQISKDYQTYGVQRVDDSLSSYQSLIPTAQESAAWANYKLTDAAGNANLISVDRISNWQYTNLQSKYSGLSGNVATYRITSKVSDVSSKSQVRAGIQQDVQLASIPIFSYWVLYAPDLEICPGAAVTFNGRMHCNGNIYLEPSVALTIGGHITSSKNIFHNRSPSDPVSRTLGTISYLGKHDGGAMTLNLPIGTNNSLALLRNIVESPPPSESASSALGLQRFYNKADLIVLVSNTTVVATSGSYNNFSSTIPDGHVNQFVNTNVYFFDKRENKTVLAVEIDLAKLNTVFSTLTADLGKGPKSFYVADRRTQSSGTMSGVRLINGQTLPSAGLTLATPNPLYVKGHYNIYPSDLGTTNTTRTVPACLAADSITFLSINWQDSKSGNMLSDRPALNTTFNAAVVTGIVPTGNGYYSGGLENSIRLLEDWSGRTLTFNGSIAVLYYSQIATAPWGASDQVYAPPTRKYNFDQNFLKPSKLPAGTPEIRAVIRAAWIPL